MRWSIGTELEKILGDDLDFRLLRFSEGALGVVTTDEEKSKMRLRLAWDESSRLVYMMSAQHGYMIYRTALGQRTGKSTAEYRGTGRT